MLEFEGQSYGKAKDGEEAFNRLMKFSGKTHYLHSAYSLYFYEKDKEPELIGNYLVSVEMKMRDFSEKVAKNYIASGEWKGVPAVINLKIKDLTFLKVLKVSPRLLLVYPFSVF